MSNQETTLYVNYFDEIDPVRMKVLMALISDALVKHNPDVLYFLFASGGGNVAAGIVFYNFLKALNVKVIMHNTGVINSVANIIFLAGKERYAAKHSSFLFHGISMGTDGTPLTLDTLNEKKSSLESDENKIIGIVQENTKLTDAKIRSFFKTGEAVDVNFAKNNGIIHDIKNPSIPRNALLMSVNININVK